MLKPQNKICLLNLIGSFRSNDNLAYSCNLAPHHLYMENFSPNTGFLHPDQPPDLEKYSFIKEIGRGSFSTVYLASKIDSDPGNPYVAIKVIQRRKITKRLEFHLRQEISILKKLNEDLSQDREFQSQLSGFVHENQPKNCIYDNRKSSTNIIKFYEMIKCKSVICLVMEWCSYGDLTNLLLEQKQFDRHHFTQLQILQRKPELLKSSNMIQKSPINNDTVLSQPYWTRESNVKDFIVQLDPDNSSLNDQFGPCSSFSSYFLKVADFGFARYMNPSDMADTLCGSPLYMAPEILQNGKYDAKADLWSVGCIMFELLFARGPPFRAPNHISLAKKYEDPELVNRLFVKLANEGAVDIWANLSKECLLLLQSLLTVDPLKRISFDEFFAHPWLHSRQSVFKKEIPPPGPKLSHTKETSRLQLSLFPHEKGNDSLSHLVQRVYIDPLNKNAKFLSPKSTVASISISDSALGLFPFFLREKKTLNRILYSSQVFLVKLKFSFISPFHFQLIVHILGTIEEIMQIAALLEYSEIFTKGRYLFKQYLHLAEKLQNTLNENKASIEFSIEKIFNGLIYEINSTPGDTEWLSWFKFRIFALNNDSNKFN